ncbi:TonB-dependent receptor [Catalinimonas sp. 4WD22]|uniref:SusC/RagA family TonB-linked outer membrane protein n=1 Tax=Catalinimonas locisalis TaxID=3133978 RepID=UPI003100BC39
MRKFLFIASKILLVLMCFISFSAYSQHFANNQNVGAINFLSQDNKSTTLKSLLLTYEQEYEVSIVFNSREIGDQKVILPDRQQENLESTLKEILEPLGLKFKKIDERIYVIQANQYKKEELKKVDINNAFAYNSKNHIAKHTIGTPRISKVLLLEQTISGRVTDGESGEPLPGVNILAKGTNMGTVSDANGDYRLTVSDDVSILVFSSIGYTAEEVEINGRTSIDLELMPDIKALSEVVVVGYGTQEKSKLVGSVSQVSSQAINDRPVPQLRQALTGQMPGVTITQTSGQPGNQGGNIQIRGVSSVNSSNAPLILVDGIPTSSFNDIDPNVVENISVLKDASSAAIYGARAANGVILVTTKTAKSDQLRVTYNGYAGIQVPTEYPEYVNSWEYAELLNESNANDDLPPAYSSDEIELFRNGTDPDNYPNSDFINRVLKKQAAQTGHNITISNGMGSSNYLLSLGYLYQNGIIDDNNYNRYNVRLNVVSSITDKIKLTSRLAGVQVYDEQPSGPATLGNAASMLGIIGQAVRYPAIYPIRLSNGDWGGGFEQSGTPASFLASDSYYEQKSTDLFLNMQLDWDILPDLKFSLIGGYTYFNNQWERFSASQQISPTNILEPATLNTNSAGRYYRTLQQLLSYNKILGDHEVTLLVGHTYETELFEESTAFRQGFPNNEITVLDVGSAEGMQNSGRAEEWALDSYLARLRYSYQNKYLVEGVVRHDGSSRFPPSKKYATFPSVAVGWRISEESFMESASNWLDELKLKASWGRLGNQTVNSNSGGVYPYQNILQTGYNYPFGNSINTGVARVNITDSNLTWETTESIDIGLESSFLKNSLNFSVTYFDRETFDILLSPGSSVSNTLGFGVGVQNSGRLENKGFEFTLGHRGSSGEFTYNISSNFTILNNQMLDLGVGNIVQPNGLIGNGSDLFVGEPLELYYGLVADGLFIDQQDINEYPDQSAVNTTPNPGDIRYKDINGPDGVPDGQVDATYDRAVLGSRIPKYNYGINLAGGYKGFNLSILLQGVAEVNGRLDNAAGYAFFNQGSIQRWQAEERWRPDNPSRNAEYPRLETIPNGGTANSLLSSYWVLDASYLKVRNVQLTYSLPASLLENLKLQALQFRLSGENLLAFHNYRDGWDPELNTSLNYYPILRNYTLGIKVTF